MAKGLITTRIVPPEPSQVDFSPPRAAAYAPGTRGFYPGSSHYRDADPRLFASKDVLFGPGLLSADRENELARPAAVANSRHVDRNDPQIHGALTKRAINITGANIRMQSTPNWKALMRAAPRMSESYAVGFAEDFANQLEAEFTTWADDGRAFCDAERHYQFGGLMMMAARNVFGPEGETGIIARYDEDRRDSYRSNYSTFIEVIEPQRIATPPERTGEEGRSIKRGRVLDRWGAYLGYYCSKGLPKEASSINDFTFVPRETSFGRPVGLHWFMKHRAGLQRGMPSIIAGLGLSAKSSKLDDAELEERILASLLSMVVQTDKSSDEVLKMLSKAPTGGGNSIADSWDARFSFYDDMAITADGKRVPVLPPGDEIKMQAVEKDSTSAVFRDAIDRKLASMMLMSLNQFTGDYSKTNYSGARQGLIDSHKVTVAERHLMMQGIGSPIVMALAEELISTRAIVLPAAAPDFFENMAAYCDCDFMGPGMGWIDPKKEVEAAALRIGLGVSTHTDEAALQGRDFYENVDRQARDRQYAADRGVPITGATSNSPSDNGDAEDVDDDAADDDDTDKDPDKETDDPLKEDENDE